MKRAAAAISVMVAGTAPAAAPPALDMTAFFTGRTHAENVLNIFLSRSSRLVVDSVGRSNGKEFVLIDTIHENGKPVRERKWIMRPAGPNHFTGTLSDAVGPVDVRISGNQATIRYTMNGGLKVDELLQLLADGRTLANHVAVRRFGLKFASIEGKIRKLD